MSQFGTYVFAIGTLTAWLWSAASHAQPAPPVWDERAGSVCRTRRPYESRLHKYSRDGGARARAHCSVRRRSDLRSAGPTMGPTALVLLRTSVLYSTYGHETAWTASYEPVRQAVLDTDPDSAAADESFFWIQIPILLLLMKVFYNEAKRGKIGH
jgi:hypothetical protein